jgi:hypothetical protein
VGNAGGLKRPLACGSRVPTMSETSPPRLQMSAATSPLELEHVIGWTGAHPQTLCLHPTEETTFFSALGASVVIGDVYDPHKQRFLRAHDADVTALDVSSTGRLCASGQRRSTLIATGDATVHVWDVARGSIVYTLFGLTEAVQLIAFSPDERFLVAASADNTIAIWDMLSGEQVRWSCDSPDREGSQRRNPQLSRGTRGSLIRTPAPPRSAPLTRRCTQSVRAREAGARAAFTFSRGAL